MYFEFYLQFVPLNRKMESYFSYLHSDDGVDEEQHGNEQTYIRQSLEQINN